MSAHENWHSIAERLAESGWSWRHETLQAGGRRELHLAEARDDTGQRHVVIAESARPAFAALEESVRAVGA